MSHRRTKMQIWVVPAVLAALSLLGLIAALLADGPGDVVSWLTLAAPVAVVSWCSLRRA